MADPAPNGFENLTQSGIIRVNSKDDKNVSLSLDVYMGNTSLVVFTGAGGKPWKLGLPPKVQANIVIMLKKMQAEPRPCREPIFINEFVEEGGKKQFKQKGCIGIGIDENLGLFIDVAANDLNGRHLFPFKGDGRFDFSNTSMSEKDTLVGMLEFLINSFSTTVILAERISSFKRTGGNSGGGSKGNYGGGNRGSNNYGGGSGGNYGGNSQQSSTFGGSPDVENDLHV